MTPMPALKRRRADSAICVGTQNLRVVDAGIFPVIPAAHLQAVVYGVAEKV